MSQPPMNQPSETEDLLSVLRLIAERAGKVILGYYVEGEEIEVRHKEDASPVTEADEAAEHFILEALAKLTPEIPVISEEAASAGALPEIAGSRFWLVDPLDGTKEFISRNGEFTVNIALIEEGQPVAGVVHAPALSQTFWGAPGSGAFEGERPISTSITPVLEEAILATGFAYERHTHADDNFENVRRLGLRAVVTTAQQSEYPQPDQVKDYDQADLPFARSHLLRTSGDSSQAA